MTADRRRGSESSPTRQLLLDETERLMLEEGYAAVGVRRLAREAGVAPALVLYYFKTLDDLFLAVLKRRADGEFERQQRLLDSKPPLQALWELSRDPGLALITEFMALANHREAVRVAFAADAERYRKAQVEAIMRKAESGLPDVSPAALVVATTGIARILGMESALGITGGHEETVALIEDLLKRFYGSSSLAVDHD
ncbi:TetR/AcrR family transcriptional regulator [Amycolatopsis acidicola]|uniref:TetR/AcrR family transcriptional regulator n=1 Tax=Amycolatopsis acidicola TaxID=2596893 RepID=A0A5N0V7B0_9PSEU|nr:TetR/AcrR family transcriptional regulator [Amycolatopsis acidicola]KAA9161594.1 TetR/AcrR family transcriptional regulator [Amycolatopsis acidicola]